MNLKKQSGIPLTFDTTAIIFGSGVIGEPLHVRTREDARPYLMDAAATARRKNLYAMYRDVHREQDEAIFRKNRIRYDITVIFPGTLGGKTGEYIRTIGHAHPAAEIYEVLEGDALFVLQHIGGKQNDIQYIAASKGEKMIIPSGYGHITINTGAKPLILADLFAASVQSDYSFFKKHHGPAYWVTPPAGKATGFALTENPSHKTIGECILGIPADLSPIGLPAKKPLYTLFTEDPKRFSFLTNRKKEARLIKDLSPFDIAWQGKLA